MQRLQARVTHALGLALLFVATVATIAQAQAKITSPKEFFGHNIGDDYWLPTYDQFRDYWHKIAAETDRMSGFEIGKSAEGRPQLAALATTPEKLKNTARSTEIARK